MEFFTATGKLLPHTRQPKLMHVWQQLEYRINVCRITSPMVHTSNISSCQKKKLFQFSCGCEQFH